MSFTTSRSTHLHTSKHDRSCSTGSQRSLVTTDKLLSKVVGAHLFVLELSISRDVPACFHRQCGREVQDWVLGSSTNKPLGHISSSFKYKPKYLCFAKHWWTWKQHQRATTPNPAHKEWIKLIAIVRPTPIVWRNKGGKGDNQLQLCPYTYTKSYQANMAGHAYENISGQIQLQPARIYLACSCDTYWTTLSTTENLTWLKTYR